MSYGDRLKDLKKTILSISLVAVVLIAFAFGKYFYIFEADSDSTIPGNPKAIDSSGNNINAQLEFMNKEISRLSSEIEKSKGALKEIQRLSSEIEKSKNTLYDAIVIASLQNTYQFSRVFFRSYPHEALTESILDENHLFFPEDVTLTIISGKHENLAITGAHVNIETVYSLDADGNISPDSPLTDLASAYLLFLNGYVKRGYNASANRANHTAYTTAMAYFVDYPTADMDIEKITMAGYKEEQGIILDVTGKMNNLFIKSYHINGSKIFFTDFEGNSVSEEKSNAHYDTVLSDLRKAYRASQKHFANNHRPINLTLLLTNGYVPSPDITVMVVSDEKKNMLLKMTHPKVKNTYYINQAGAIKFNHGNSSGMIKKNRIKKNRPFPSSIRVE